MEWSMKDEAFKIEMFRFVDVFPTLKDHVQVAEHLQEYFCRPEQDFPAMFQWGLGRVKPDSMIAKLAADQITKQIVGMAERFIPGETAADSLKTLRAMWDSGQAFTLDLLGEAAVSEAEAAVYLERYNEILDTLAEHSASWPANATLEKSPYGPVPRVNVSVKITSLFSQIDPIDFQGSIDAVKERLRPLFRKAKQLNAFINIDLEQYKYKDLTYATFMSLLEEPEFADFANAGIVAQAYLVDCENDLKELVKWAKKRKAPVTVRLVKGAYWDYETIHAEQQGWACPVFTQKWQTDASYERCTELLLDNHKYIRTAVASHNVRSIAHAMAYAQANRLDKSALEFQMLYGMAEPMKAAVISMGYRLRDYVPIGEMIPGMAYLVRRLLENTSNESWLRLSFVEGQSLDKLLADPADAAKNAAPAKTQRTGLRGARRPERTSAFGPIPEFANEPLRDFSRAEDRDVMQKAVDSVRAQLGKSYPLILNNKAVQTAQTLPSVNPAAPAQVVGISALASIEQAQQAIASAAAAQKDWAAQTAETRADFLFAIADEIRKRRDELSAWMVWEVGKTWAEADADTCEAIDFCEYYAREMLRLARPQRMGRLPGELNHLFYQPRGVTAVIAPWNFPLAILTGMTVAAAVTGNAVIMKPAEQSPVIAAKLMECIQTAKVPAGVINFLPGHGHEVGKFLVDSPEVHIVAFTGSMEVGLEILRSAANTPAGQHHIKKVVCEMGGKNAIIVDADADLDEAVQGVVQSAFGFQGQKCSACSRVIVLESCYDEFKTRLTEAARSMMIGAPHDPATRIGPVVDADAKAKIEHFINLGQQEGRLLLRAEIPPAVAQSGGYFVTPTIFEDIAPNAQLAQQEVFGPVLALMRARTFEEALEIANATPFALTGGVFSRSPSNLDLARQKFNVGNLYINRGITGALVYRNPFGGFKMSGSGTKAGGPDYLLHFMEPRAITENTMRRGFAPAD